MTETLAGFLTICTVAGTIIGMGIAWILVEMTTLFMEGVRSWIIRTTHRAAAGDAPVRSAPEAQDDSQHSQEDTSTESSPTLLGSSGAPAEPPQETIVHRLMRDDEGATRKRHEYFENAARMFCPEAELNFVHNKRIVGAHGKYSTYCTLCRQIVPIDIHEWML